MSKILKTIKEQLHTFAMTDTERADIRLHIASHMHNYKPSGRIASPYMFGVWQKRLSVSMAAFLIVMITGGSGLAYASNDALPGDALYNIKVNGVEEVQAAVKQNSQARAEFEVKRVEKRLGEAVTLAAKGQLDEKKKESITQNLERHTKKVTEETTKLIQENPDEAVEVSAKLALSLQAHSEAIAVAQEQNKVNGELDSIVEQVVAAQEHAEVEKVTASEMLVANGEAGISIEELTQKKDRLNKSYVAAFGTIEATVAPEVPTTESTTVVTDTELATEATMKMSLVTPDVVSENTALLIAEVSIQDQIAALFAEADASIANNNYTEAFFTLQRAEELLLKIEISSEVEKSLSDALATPIDTAPVEVAPTIQPEATVETSVKTETSTTVQTPVVEPVIEPVIDISTQAIIDTAAVTPKR